MSREAAPRLGRGLAALLGEAPAAPGLSVVDLPHGRLRPNPSQPRDPIEPATLSDLAASIRTQGILQPIIVRPAEGDSYEIVAGERRWRAAMQVGLAQIPCIVQPMDDDRAATAALVENLQRLDLNPLEEARGYQKLQRRFGLSQDQVADVIGKSRSHIANTLRLLKLSPGIRDLLASGELSAGHARALLAHPNPDQAADAIVSNHLSVREAEALTSRTRDHVQQEGPTTDPDIDALADEVSGHLGMLVNLQVRHGKGRLSIRFSTLDQLEFLLERLRSGGSLPKEAVRG